MTKPYSPENGRTAPYTARENRVTKPNSRGTMRTRRQRKNGNYFEKNRVEQKRAKKAKPPINTHYKRVCGGFVDFMEEMGLGAAGYVIKSGYSRYKIPMVE